MAPDNRHICPSWKRKRVCVLGSGSWGSTIARIVARNVLYLRNFHHRVTMYVVEEVINGKKLTDIINKEHENIKYAPGYKFTPNLVALADPADCVKNADIIIFVVPHQYLLNLCKLIIGKIKNKAIGISLIKGFGLKAGGGIELISDLISKQLKISCHVMMGANIASEVAAEKVVCTSTLGCKNKSRSRLLKSLFHNDHLNITVVDDEDTVEVCGALKNIVATGVGFVDGLDGNNRVKEAAIRIGFMEMVQFVDCFYPGGKLSTFFESCGIFDLIVTSFAGRNRLCSEEFVRSGKTLQELEVEMLHGQKLQGPVTAEEVHNMLKKYKALDKFPLFTTIHEICIRQKPPDALLTCIDDNISKRTYKPKNILA